MSTNNAYPHVAVIRNKATKLYAESERRYKAAGTNRQLIREAVAFQRRADACERYLRDNFGKGAR